jgi:hypothetical protein
VYVFFCYVQANPTSSFPGTAYAQQPPARPQGGQVPGTPYYYGAQGGANGAQPPPPSYDSIGRPQQQATQYGGAYGATAAYGATPYTATPGQPQLSLAQQQAQAEVGLID